MIPTPRESWICPNAQCREPFRAPEVRCVVCGASLGYPNVRVANTPSEVEALEARYRLARRDVEQRGCKDLLEKFEVAVQKSKAVVCRSLNIVAQLVLSDDPLYSTYYKAVDQESRRIDLSAIDNDRRATDVLMFPGYHEHIVFAALSVDGFGNRDYGRCSLVLRDMAVQGRASVFEKNSVTFCREHVIGVGRPVPPGHRATWDRRHLLAAVKVATRLDPTVKPADFPRLLLSQRSKTRESDFMEVHIYGPIHRRALEVVHLPRPRQNNDGDVAITMQIESALEEAGVKVKLH